MIMEKKWKVNKELHTRLKSQNLLVEQAIQMLHLLQIMLLIVILLNLIKLKMMMINLELLLKANGNTIILIKKDLMELLPVFHNILNKVRNQKNQFVTKISGSKFYIK